MQFRRERVRVETQRHIIEGTLQLPHEGYRSRTTDYLNAHDSDFIALIDADVAWADGSREPERQEYLAILARWYYSSWREGEWIGFANFEDIPYRKLVNAVSRVAKPGASAP